VTTNIIKVESMDGLMRIKQETEEGYRSIEAAVPCVVTVQKPDYDPRYPTIKSKMAARKKEIKELTASEEGNSMLEVIRVFEPAKRAAGIKLKADSEQEVVAQAMSVMTAAKVF